MKPSKNCLSLINNDNIEGFKSAPYPDDGGVATIGYGTTIYPNGKRVTLKDKPITKEQAWTYLEYHCEIVAKQIEPLIKVELNQNQIDAIISFVYNEGIGQFRDSTLFIIINNNPNDLISIKEQWMRWVYGYNSKTKQQEIVKGLENRRMIEFNLYSKII